MLRTYGTLAQGNALMDASASGVSARPVAAGELILGVSGARRNAAVAACQDGVLTAVCEQERLSRIRGVRLEPGRLPEQAVAAVLRMVGRGENAEVHRYAIAEEGVRLPGGLAATRVGHHRAHAASAFFPSTFDQAAILVCDGRSAPPTSVWVGSGNGLTQAPLETAGANFAALYTAAAELFGFPPGQEHRLEALARLGCGPGAARLEAHVRYTNGSVRTSPGWRDALAQWLGDVNGNDPVRHRACVASALQCHLGRLLLELAADIRVVTGARQLCLAGGLFYNTYFNTVIRRSGIFDDVFVPTNPGNAGLASGAALAAAGRGGARAPAPVSPFLGPEYNLQEMKATLDNCKLSYTCASEGDVVAAAVDALKRGQLVGWFQGRMEWGHRALGNRSILASPLSPYVLDNLNLFLKQREAHRTYGLSVPETAAPQWFAGPPVSRFMEYDYEILDRDRFRHVLPKGTTTLRVQTIPDSQECRRYRLLHDAFQQATGVPVLVNTSFNGFLEPIVCSPRDAIRVFFGTGLDMLILDRFILRK